MSNRSVPARTFLALVFAAALVALWSGSGRAEDAEAPEAGAAESSDDKPAAAEGFAPEAEDAAPASAEARAHGQAMCARLGELMAKGLSYAERTKTAQTRAALHCPATAAATQSAENPAPSKR
jgi:hypothetical protein